MQETYDVVVIGAGPVGLATALQLGRRGVATLLVERRDTLSHHPKAGGIHARTMEIFRQWGVADAIREAGRGVLPPSASGPTGFGWMTRLSGTEIGRISFGASAEDRVRFARHSPEFACGCGQDLYEPILLAEVHNHPAVTVRFGLRATVVEQDDVSVLVALDDPGADTRIGTVKARYVVACDGVRSPTRRTLGIGEQGEPAFGNSINVRFRADLERHRGGRRYGLFWVINPETQGAFGWRRRQNEWTYNFEAAPGEDPATYTAERCVEIVRQGIGDPDIEVDIVSILHWKHDQAVSDSWRAGRVLLAGDSAHRFPPHGGFGMNSGVQDSVNLVWKLQLVLQGLADKSLLDSYQEERKPVALFNGEQCLLNTKRMEETGWLLPDATSIAQIEDPGPAGQAVRDRIAAAIPRQREQFYSHGQQFGTIYASRAVIDDGTEPELSTISEYRMTGQPGARAPHLWLRAADGSEISTIDLFYDGFVLLHRGDRQEWSAAARAVTRATGVLIDGHAIGPGGQWFERNDQPRFTDLYGIETSGAVLVRPDGHVGFRSVKGEPDPTVALADAVRRLLGKHSRQAPSPIRRKA
ncbi:FAD-dependent oxidoreductase [Streptomyces jeddahensis]|uniref:2,4-dichlorophenol 6-monooxygenase n=1 Tax=Streptomyces jeddahensis TaxID=1716141 RepID=A0A177HL59_9ACTN|nr:FAD-dependent oxidoreductase [Streptomyces jeddahensis]OAH11742.1 2,4-dichlorophenol 6-monooxygenase [Streptomyces jeddahensis]